MRVTNLQKIQDKVLGDYGYGAFGIPFGKKIEDSVHAFGPFRTRLDRTLTQREAIFESITQAKVAYLI